MSTVPITLLYAPVCTVATLPTGASAGGIAYATDCRALVAMIGGAGTFPHVLQSKGAGTGALVVFNGNSWQIVGTTITASS